MQYITVRITGPTHPYLDTQVAAAAMLLGNARSVQIPQDSEKKPISLTFA